MRNTRLNSTATVKALALGSLTLLMSACGGDGGGGAKLGDFQIQQGDFSFVYPTANSTNICTYPTMKVSFNRADICASGNLDKVPMIYSSSPSNRVSIIGFAKNQNGNTCEISFQAGLNPSTQYQFSIAGSDAELIAPVPTRTIAFTTGNATCNTTSAFNVSGVVNSKTVKGDILTTGTIQDGKIVFDGQGLLTSATNLIQQGALSFLGIGKPATVKLEIQFTERPDIDSLKGSAGVYSVGVNGLTRVSGVDFVPKASEPNKITVTPPEGGYVNGSYVLIIEPVLSAESGRYTGQLDSTRATSTIASFTVSN